MDETNIYMPMERFKDQLLPLPAHAQGTMAAVKVFSALRGVRSEKRISRKFIEIVNGPTKRIGSLVPGLKMALSENGSETLDEQHPTVHGAFYVDGEAPTNARPNWEKVRMLVEFNRGGQEGDPYAGIKDGVATDDSKDALEHLADHIVNVFELGHRLAVYVLLITGTKARMTRWDRSGSIYTDAFDYVKRPDILRDLLWRFSLLSGVQQGLDPTVSAVSPEEHKLMDTLAAKNPRDLSDQEGTEVPPRAPDDPPYVFAYVRKMFAASLNPNWPRWKTSVEAEGGRQEFLAGMPQVLLPGLVERGTRGYVAYDCMDKRFVWLKDTWRPGFSREGETMEILAAAGVKNIPTVVCHGETGHATQTPLYAQCTKADSPKNAQQVSSRAIAGKKKQGHWQTVPPELDDPFSEGAKKIRPLKHYRLVLEEVCRPLGDFLCARDLVVIVRDAIIAHGDAVDLAGLLHRDVSAGNILVCPHVVTREDGSCYVTRGGLLGDWEHAKNLRDDGRDDGKHQGRRQTERGGTWQYISAYSLDHPLEPMTTADDIESFFYILLRCGVRYLRHNCSDVSYFLSDFFDAHTPYGNTLCCGIAKREAMHNGWIRLYRDQGLIFKNEDGSPHVFHKLIETLLSWFRARYTFLDPPQPLLCMGFDDFDNAYEAALAAHRERQRELFRKPAEKVSRHEDVIDLFNEFLTRAWPTKDKVGDQSVRRSTPVAAAISDAPGAVSDAAATADDSDSDEPAAACPAKRRAADQISSRSATPTSENGNKKRKVEVLADQRANPGRHGGRGRPKRRAL